jgi:Ca-activated chloride channel family protein
MAEKIKSDIISGFSLVLILLGCTQIGSAQKSIKEIRQGNKHYEKSEYQEAEQSYRDALEANNFNYDEATYNLANALYMAEDNELAIKEFSRITELSANQEIRQKAFHNLGNAYFKEGKLKESVEAYKNALRINPNFEDARYNMEYVKQFMQNQDNQDNQDGDDQNEDNNEDQDKNDNDQNQDKDNNEGDNDEQNQDQDQQNQDQNNENQEQDNQQQQPQEAQMSPEDAQRLLDALNQDEKDVQKKVIQQQLPAKTKNIEKDW